jgi:hypothetical protein
METSDSIVFNQAIRIPAGAELASDFEKSIYTSTAVFNYALARHFKASSGDAISMSKVEKLYAMVLKMLDNNGICWNLHIAIVIKLACINNLSQIRYSNGDYENGREGFLQVSRFIRKSSNQTIFEEPKIRGLLMNILLLMPPFVAPAA